MVLLLQSRLEKQAFQDYIDITEVKIRTTMVLQSRLEKQAFQVRVVYYGYGIQIRNEDGEIASCNPA